MRTGLRDEKSDTLPILPCKATPSESAVPALRRDRPGADAHSRTASRTEPSWMRMRATWLEHTCVVTFKFREQNKRAIYFALLANGLPAVSEPVGERAERPRM